MPWFAAHAIMYFRLKSGQQECYRVQENVFLVKAATSREAWDRAKEMARQDEGDSSGSLHLDDEPCELVFGGLRKVVELAHAGTGSAPGHGDELTYSEYEVADKDALRRLIADEDVALLYLGER